MHLGDIVYIIKRVTDKISLDELNEIYEKMPLPRRQRVDKIKHDNDRANSIIAWDMLEELMQKNGINVYDYEYNASDNGKPYFVDCPFHFSISHSSNYVMVGVSDCEIGVDIQHAVDDYDKIAKRVCTPNELALINDKYDFNAIWAKKEATVKCIGVGIAGLSDVDTTLDNGFEYKVQTLFNNKEICIAECKNMLYKG